MTAAYKITLSGSQVVDALVTYANKHQLMAGRHGKLVACNVCPEPDGELRIELDIELCGCGDGSH